MLYIGACFTWIGLGLVPVMLLLFGADDMTSPLALSLSAVGMSGGAAAIAEAMRRIRQWEVPETWALRRVSMPVGFWGGAVLGALTLGVVGEWLGVGLWEVLNNAFGWELPNNNLAAIAESLRHGALGERALFVAVVVLIGPLLEELVFRGFLWRVLEGNARPVGAILGTSLVFGMWHLDPIQSVGVLPLSFFLGVVRWRSGSLRPCIAIHVLNNGLAAATILAGWDEPTSPSWLVAALIGGIGAFLVIKRHPRPHGAHKNGGCPSEDRGDD